jgi:hypothetical protein
MSMTGAADDEMPASSVQPRRSNQRLWNNKGFDGVVLAILIVMTRKSG